MNWNGWQDFAHMGGHGLFVWGSVGVVWLALLAEWLWLNWLGQQVSRDVRLWVAHEADAGATAASFAVGKEQP